MSLEFYLETNRTDVDLANNLYRLQNRAITQNNLSILSSPIQMVKALDIYDLKLLFYINKI